MRYATATQILSLDEPPNERALWQAVVLQIFLDALQRKASKLRFEARGYILNDPDFEVISLMAEYNPEKLQRSLRSILHTRRRAYLNYLKKGIKS